GKHIVVLVLGLELPGDLLPIRSVGQLLQHVVFIDLVFFGPFANETRYLHKDHPTISRTRSATVASLCAFFRSANHTPPSSLCFASSRPRIASRSALTGSAWGSCSSMARATRLPSCQV